MDLKIFNEMVRPCMAKGHKAAFHRWVEHSYVEPPGILTGSSNGGQVTYLTALVEFETGQVVEVRPSDVVFRDGMVNSYLHEYCNLIDDERYEQFLKECVVKVEPKMTELEEKKDIRFAKSESQ